MAAISELIRTEGNGTLSFGDNCCNLFVLFPIGYAWRFCAMSAGIWCRT